MPAPSGLGDVRADRQDLSRPKTPQSLMLPLWASAAMASARLGKLDRKLKRLRSLEAYYRRELKFLEEEFKEGRLPKDRYHRRQARNQRGMDRMLVKIKQLTARRAKLAGDR